MTRDFDVVEFPEPDCPAVGEEAPGFTRPLVTDEYWTDVSLDELVADGPAVLVFSPMNGTGRSIHTWTDIPERGWDATVAGVSIGTPYDNAAFIDAWDVPYGLFSDPANAVAEAYGVVHDVDGMTGIAEPRVAAFVIDGDRRVAGSWVASAWPQALDYDAVEAVLATL